jgi:hypothetical protein
VPEEAKCIDHLWSMIKTELLRLKSGEWWGLTPNTRKRVCGVGGGDPTRVRVIAKIDFRSTRRPLYVSLAPSDGERAGVRGLFKNCLWQSVWASGARVRVLSKPRVVSAGRRNLRAGGPCYVLPRVFDAAALPEELEHVALVGLIPRNFHGRNRADVQAIDFWVRHHFFDECRILGDDRCG